MDLKSTYTVFKFCLKWKEIFISLKFNNIRNITIIINLIQNKYNKKKEIYYFIIFISLSQR